MGVCTDPTNRSDPTLCCCQDDEDVYILSKVSDVMHALFSSHKEAILPFFDQLLPLFVKLLVGGASQFVVSVI